MKKNKKSKAEVYNSDLLINLLSQITPEEQKVIDRKMLLAAKIEEAMKAKGWNRTRFAQEMGKHNSEISKWLSGTHSFTSETLWAIGDKLGIELLPVGEMKKVIEVKYVPIVVQATPQHDFPKMESLFTKSIFSSTSNIIAQQSVQATLDVVN